jgi:hypothetical protein
MTGSRKCGEFLDYLRTSQLLTKSCAPVSCLVDGVSEAANRFATRVIYYLVISVNEVSQFN